MTAPCRVCHAPTEFGPDGYPAGLPRVLANQIVLICAPCVRQITARTHMEAS